MARSSWRNRARLAAVAVVVATCTVSAHRRDEYLQAARISIDPARVQIELDLTPGIAVADGIVRDIDTDRGGEISDTEAAAYTQVVLRALRLDVDGRVLPLELVDQRFPSPAAMREGDAPIRLRLIAGLPELQPGAHALTFHNGHRPDVGVYLANALVPSNDRIAVSAQERDVAQRQLTIAYQLRADPLLIRPGRQAEVTWGEFMPWQPIIFGWPTILLTIAAFGAAFLRQRSSLGFAGLALAVPFLWYVSLAGGRWFSLALFIGLAGAAVFLRQGRRGLAFLCVAPFAAMVMLLAAAVVTQGR